MKYSGADWIQKDLFYENPGKLSPLAVKVANVMGQVSRGIYHIDESPAKASLQNLKPWQSFYEIAWYGELATFDLPELTILYYCCMAAGLQVSIRGRCEFMLTLTFIEKDFDLCDVESFDSTFDEWIMREYPKSFRYSRGETSRKPRELLDHWRDGSAIYLRSYELSFSEIHRFVLMAHQTQSRVSISGRCHTGFGSIGLTISDRKDPAGCVKSHPTAEESRQRLDHFWEGIDFESVT